MPREQFIDCYEVLGLKQDCDPKAVRSRFRLLVKRYHPDVHPNPTKETSERFLLIRRAYEVLADPKSRAQHDRERAQKQTTVRGASAARTSAVGSTAEWRRACQEFPELLHLFEDCKAISPSLAESFRFHLLTSKDYGVARAVAARLKLAYSERYLDKAPQLLNFPDWLGDK